jgi:hypothetical protein
MEELNRLTEILGSPKKTAEELGVDIRSYWNYKADRIPDSMRKLITLKLRELDNPPESQTPDRAAK